MGGYKRIILQNFMKTISKCHSPGKKVFSPGDLICLKKTYRGLGHPDDLVVGLIISCGKNLCVLFSERFGVPAIEDFPSLQGEVYYHVLSTKRFDIHTSVIP